MVGQACLRNRHMSPSLMSGWKSARREGCWWRGKSELRKCRSPGSARGEGKARGRPAASRRRAVQAVLGFILKVMGTHGRYKERMV